MGETEREDEKFHVCLSLLSHRDALTISLINCGTSIVAGFAIFSVVGFMAEQQGKTVPEVASQGMDEGDLGCK